MRSLRICLIEDDPACSSDYEALLIDRGHKVTIYDDADAVVSDLDLIAKSDVIVLDLMMLLGTKIEPSEGDETGIAIYKRLRRVSATVHIVVITARSPEEVWKFFENDTNCRFLGKPVSDAGKLFKAIEEW